MQLISTFRRLDLQAASYEGSYHIKSITNEFIHYPELLPDTRRIAYLEFESFLEARSYLDCFVLSAFYFMRSTAEPLKYLQGDKLMELGYQSVASERDVHIEKLHNWLESFRRLISNHPIPLDNTEKLLAARCRISNAATVVALSACLSPHEMACDECLPCSSKSSPVRKISCVHPQMC
jgi:hypothetical protein